jgi:hypothetical protein
VYKMIHRQLTALSAVAFVLAGNTNVLAVPVNSWNLSRDLMSIPGYPTAPTYTNSPTVGAWTFLYGSIGSPLPLSTFTSVPNYAYWGAGSTTPGVFLPTTNFATTATFTKGLTSVHPTPTQPVIVKWAGNTTGTVRVLARFSDIDSVCGNGVKWVVYKNTTVLGTGIIANGNHGAIFDTAISVLPTDSLYFVVDANGGDYVCDSTALDVLITATP